MTNYITIKLTNTGWQAKFKGFDMPVNVWLPLPFTAQASHEIVKTDLRSRFPGALFVTKAGSF